MAQVCNQGLTFVIAAPVRHGEGRETTWIRCIGKCLNVREYMDRERLYRDGHRQNRGGVMVAMLPRCFDPAQPGVWQEMPERQYRHYTAFDGRALKKHCEAERQLAEIDDAELTYCQEGCSFDCTEPRTDADANEIAVLFRQYFLRIGGALHIILVSMKPTVPNGLGFVNNVGQFVISDEGFERRRQSMIAHKKWELQRLVLRAHNLPHIIAGPEPELMEPQEDANGASFIGQLCGRVRHELLNEAWPSFMTMRPASAASSASGTPSANNDDVAAAAGAEAAAAPPAPPRQEAADAVPLLCRRMAGRGHGAALNPCENRRPGLQLICNRRPRHAAATPRKARQPPAEDAKSE